MLTLTNVDHHGEVPSQESNLLRELKKLRNTQSNINS